MLILRSCHPILSIHSTQLANERTSIQKRYLDHWNAARSPSDRPIDAIICPGGATTAHPPTFHPYIGYTSKWNLLDYTVATFPVTKVSETDIECRTGEPLSPFEKDLIENCEFLSATHHLFPSFDWLIFWVHIFLAFPSKTLLRLLKTLLLVFNLSEEGTKKKRF